MDCFEDVNTTSMTFFLIKINKPFSWKEVSVSSFLHAIHIVFVTHSESLTFALQRLPPSRRGWSQDQLMLCVSCVVVYILSLHQTSCLSPLELIPCPHTI
jgi:choline-glycine betaine transporter